LAAQARIEPAFGGFPGTHATSTLNKPLLIGQ
jgi:hypothetical protein